MPSDEEIDTKAATTSRDPSEDSLRAATKRPASWARGEHQLESALESFRNLKKRNTEMCKIIEVLERSNSSLRKQAEQHDLNIRDKDEELGKAEEEYFALWTNLKATGSVLRSKDEEIAALQYAAESRSQQKKDLQRRLDMRIKDEVRAVAVVTAAEAVRDHGKGITGQGFGDFGKALEELRRVLDAEV